MFQLVLRIFLGCLLIFSGIIKLYPVEYFENLLISNEIASIQLAPYLSRLLISLELFLGLGILSTFFDRWAIRGSMLMLVGYTLWLAYLWLIKGETDNCGCFGDKIIMTPAQATLKNIATLVLLLFLREKKNNLPAFRFKKLAVALFAVLSLSLPFILTPVIFAKPEVYAPGEQPLLDLSSISTDSLLLQRLAQGEHVIAFFLSTCDHCELAAKRLETLYQAKKIDVHAFIYNSPKRSAPEFANKTKLSFPFASVDDLEKIFPIAGNRFPSVLIVKNGRIEKRLGFYDLEELLATP